MKLSVIIPTYNSGRYIYDVLCAIEAQNVVPDEVIVVDDGTTDNTLRLIENLEGEWLKIVRKEHTGLPDTRNVGLKHATGDLICFLDSDMVVEPNYFEEILKTDWSKFEAATGYVDTLNKDKSLFCAMDEATLRYAFPKEPMIFSRENPKTNYFNYTIKRSALDLVGGFDTMYKTNGEDIDFFHRFFALGYRVSYNPNAVVHHIYEVYGLTHWIKKRWGYGRSALVVMKYKSTPLKKILHYGRVLLFFVLIVMLVGGLIFNLYLWGLGVFLVGFIWGALWSRGHTLTRSWKLGLVYALTVSVEQVGRVYTTLEYWGSLLRRQP